MRRMRLLRPRDAKGLSTFMELPWSEVNARPGYQVAQLLEPHGLVKARSERYKWACPTSSCTSSDGFHTFPQPGRRSRCYVCQTPLTNVDLAALVRGEKPGDACRWLAGQLGIYVEPWLSGRLAAVAPRPLRPAALPPPAQPPRLGLADSEAPEKIYADILGRTELTALGARYLRQRGIAPQFAKQLGFRSVDGPSGWAALRRHLGQSHPPEALRAAGFARDDHARVWTPFGGMLPMLIIPYCHGANTHFVRMRTIGPPPGRLLTVIPDWADKAKRYRAPRNVVPRLPFHADALAHPVVHVIEGELNATTLLLPAYGLQAIGLPGASVFEPHWASLLAGAELVVTWYDNDPAGDLARCRVTDTFAAALGRDWVPRRLVHMRLPRGRDVNQLHLENALAPLVRACPWRDLAA
jgi:hypothetical protein